MAAPDEVDAAGLASALGPKKVQAGDDSIEQHSLADLVALSKHLRGCAAPTDSAFCGIGIVPTIPPAAG
jgi:hypothetical protein